MALDEQAVQKIRLVLSSSGWNEVMKPALENRVRQAVRSLTLTRAERSGAFKGTDFDVDDDVLRAVIRDCTWMMTCWYNEVQVSEHNRTLDELDRANSNEQSVASNRR